MYSVIGNDGQVYGPVDVATLGEWSKQGRLARDSNLIDALDGRVLRAFEVRDLQPYFFAAPPIIPQAPTVGQTGLGYTNGAAPRPASPASALPYQTAPQPTSYSNSPQPMTYAPMQQPQSYPIQQAAAFQQGVPGAPSVQVNNYIAMNQQAALVQVLPGTRNKTTAIILCAFLGCLGIHRYYLGHKGTGTAMLLLSLCSLGYLSWASFIWSIIDLIGICNNTLLDAENRALV